MKFLLIDFFSYSTFVALAGNGRGLVAVGKFEKLLLNHQIKLIRSTQLKTCTSAPYCYKPLLAEVAVKLQGY